MSLFFFFNTVSCQLSCFFPHTRHPTESERPHRHGKYTCAAGSVTDDRRKQGHTHMRAIFTQQNERIGKANIRSPHFDQSVPSTHCSVWRTYTFALLLILFLTHSIILILSHPSRPGKETEIARLWKRMKVLFMRVKVRHQWAYSRSTDRWVTERSWVDYCMKGLRGLINNGQINCRAVIHLRNLISNLQTIFPSAGLKLREQFLLTVRGTREEKTLWSYFWMCQLILEVFSWKLMNFLLEQRMAVQCNHHERLTLFKTSWSTDAQAHVSTSQLLCSNIEPFQGKLVSGEVFSKHQRLVGLHVSTFSCLKKLLN